MFSHVTEFPKRRVYKFKLKKDARCFADRFQATIISSMRTALGNYIVIL